MSIPPEFSFSQNNLQDFLDCPRRFELRYVLCQEWPAIRSQPVLEHEKNMQRGEQFHQMVHQHQLGLSVEQIAEQANDDILIDWWNSYLNYGIPDLPSFRYPEMSLRAPFGGYQLVAKYDLIAIQPGQQAVIVDWKTGNRKPSRTTLSRRVQTRLYPLLLTEASRSINDGLSLTPDQVEMVYWFTADPLHPERFLYTKERHESDTRFILDLIGQIVSCSQSRFPLTADEQMCRFCNYRSLCQRGDRAPEGEPEDYEYAQSFGFDLDFDQIAEIEF